MKQELKTTVILSNGELEKISGGVKGNKVFVFYEAGKAVGEVLYSITH